jgi:hypothetical protein
LDGGDAIRTNRSGGRTFRVGLVDDPLDPLDRLAVLDQVLIGHLSKLYDPRSASGDMKVTVIP